MSDIKG